MSRLARFDAIVVGELVVVDGTIPGLISLILGCGIIHSGRIWWRRMALRSNDLAIPHSIYGVSIALCILLPFAFRLRRFGVYYFMVLQIEGLPYSRSP